MDTVRRITLGLLWLAIVAVIAAGGAGLADGLDHPPGTEARPELTWAGDVATRPSLDDARAGLTEVADLVDELGVQSRGALAAMVGLDLDTVEAALARGGALVSDIRARATDVRLALSAELAFTSPTAPLVLSAEIRARHAALTSALDATLGLDDAWARLTVGALSATRLSILLGRHDEVMGEAAALGREAAYADALVRISEADAVLERTREMRTQLANTVDVTVLDEWIERNATYDAALRGLYESLVESGGTVTPAVRDAAVAESAAKGRLPPDSRGLIVIMAEIGRGGMNGAVIAIEQARGRLTAALERLDPPAEES